MLENGRIGRGDDGKVAHNFVVRHQVPVFEANRLDVLLVRAVLVRDAQRLQLHWQLVGVARIDQGLVVDLFWCFPFYS